jgi:hypothetical protein
MAETIPGESIPSRFLLALTLLDMAGMRQAAREATPPWKLYMTAVTHMALEVALSHHQRLPKPKSVAQLVRIIRESAAPKTLEFDEAEVEVVIRDALGERVDIASIPADRVLTIQQFAFTAIAVGHRLTPEQTKQWLAEAEESAHEMGIMPPSP